MLKKVATCFVSICLWFSPLLAHADLRVMAINTEWLWTPHDNHVDGGKFNRGDMSARDYEAELSFYAQLVRENDIDLVAVSEIENATVANDLARKFGSTWQAYFRQGRDTATGQDVALISRLKTIPDSVSDYGFPAGFLPGDNKGKRLSKVVGARFYHPDTNQTIGVVTSHFLSKRNDSAKKSRNRQRQANALNTVIEELARSNSIVIALGDFNDTRGSKVIAALEKTHRLKNAEVACASGPVRKEIDHILFRGVSCRDYGRIGLKSYSDHKAVFAVFDTP